MLFFKWLLQILAYLLYSLAVLGIMLWYQFPADAAKTRIESELHRFTPDLQWKIGSIGLALPVDIRLNVIEISDSREQKKQMFIIDSLSLRPDLRAYLQSRKMSAGYRLHAYDGRVKGRIFLADDRNNLRFDGNAGGIKIKGLQQILQDLDRTVSGTLSGSFTGKGQLRPPEINELQGEMLLVKGEISFQKPVLGMKQLAFTQVSSRIQYESGDIYLEDGSIESRLLAGEFNGTVNPAGSIARSMLKLKGFLIPRPEFLAGIGNDIAVNLFKKQLQKGKLPFSLNGPLKEPGIVFTGLPADFNQQLQGRR
jgi:type II secretion system protein N